MIRDIALVALGLVIGVAFLALLLHTMLESGPGCPDDFQWLGYCKDIPYGQ